MNSYTTIDGRAVAEIEEKKSRFIASLAHVETEEEALAFLEEIRAANRMARHNVYAYVLREGGAGAAGRVRYSDDGEPQKTAGMPTLEALQHAGLTDVICVVTRYFGGVLLGTGGLVRAYTGATQAGIEAATKVVVSSCVDISVRIEYPLYDQMSRIASDCGAKCSIRNTPKRSRSSCACSTAPSNPCSTKLRSCAEAKNGSKSATPSTQCFKNRP